MYMQELVERRKKEEYDAIKKIEEEERKRNEELELEKIRECQRALEREKISRGMQCTRADEVQLREAQRRQLQERWVMEQQARDLERAWHNVLLQDVARKEYQERLEAQRRHEEMIERRCAYDQQIASAREKRKQTLQEDRDRENRRLERLKKRMEEDKVKEQIRKKEQQRKNAENYIEGHEARWRLYNQKMALDRRADDFTNMAAAEALRREREARESHVKSLQRQEKVFSELQNRERQNERNMEEERDKIIRQWQSETDRKLEEHMENMKRERDNLKKKEAENYQRHLQELTETATREKEDRRQRSARVRHNAERELRLKLDEAFEEMRRQDEYREELNRQLEQNKICLISEQQRWDARQSPFTRRPQLFRESMARLDKSPGRNSTNPVHPFRRLMESKQTCLPSLAVTK